MWRVFVHSYLIWRKNGSKTRMTFSVHKQKFPSKNPLLGVHCIKFVWYVCFAAQIRFFVKVIKMDVGKSKLFWSRYYGCYMSQENVIKLWVALHPWFPESYNVLRFSEQGFKLAYVEWQQFLLVNCHIQC